MRGPSTRYVHCPRQVTSSLWWGSNLPQQSPVLGPDAVLMPPGAGVGASGSGLITLDPLLPEQGALCSHWDRYLFGCEFAFPASMPLPELASMDLQNTPFHHRHYSDSFPLNQLFTSGGQNTGASASASVLPMKIQD